MRPRKEIIPSIGNLTGLALCGCVVLLPLLAGGATPFGALAVRLSAMGLLLLCLFHDKFDDRLGPLPKPLTALVLLAVLGALQAVPWPRAAAHLLSPAHLALADESARAVGTELPLRVPLSLYARASSGAALDFLIFAALAVAAYRIARKAPRRVWLGCAVVGSAGVQVVAGLRPWLGGLVPRLRGTYVNPDHLCLLLEMAACVACGGIYWALSTRRFEAQPGARAAGVLVSGTLLLLLIAAVAFTGSRAGMAALLAGLVALVVATSRNRRLVAISAAGLAGLAVAGFLAWIGVAQSFGRLLATSWFEVAWTGRALVWGESLELIRRFPFLGTGLGTFEQAFPLVQPATVEGIRWARAHNDFLELAVTGGGVGVAIAAVGVILLTKELTSKLKSARRTEDRAALSVALGCLAAVAVHEAFDFGLTLPGNAFVLTSVVAAAMATRNQA